METGLSLFKGQTDNDCPAANMGFGYMAALRTYTDRYNTAQRNIQLTNKSKL